MYLQLHVCLDQVTASFQLEASSSSTNLKGPKIALKY